MVMVTGDGNSTVTELIASQVNSDPRRGPTELHPLSNIRIDSAARMELERQNLTADSVPAKDREVLIQRNANHAFDVTDDVHPETAELVSLAARVIGLDIAGIDLVAEDISKPLSAQGGAIVEVNAGPSLLMHLKPGIGKPRPVGKAIVDNLFAPDERGRIPVVGITGTHGKTAVAKLVAHLIYMSGKRVGLACSDGVHLNRRHVQKTDAASWAGGQRLLLNRSVDAAVIENGARTILGEGLAYDRCQVGIVTNIDIDAENLARWDVHPSGGEYFTTYRNTYRTQVDVVLKSGYTILNACDPVVADMAELSDGEVILFAADPTCPAMAAHLAAGKRGVIVREGRIAITTGTEDAWLLCRLGDVPIIGKQKDPATISNVLAAVAAGWALGVTFDAISTGIKTYGLDLPTPSTLLTQVAKKPRKPASRN
jgi:cyanophycin synthetase